MITWLTPLLTFCLQKQRSSKNLHSAGARAEYQQVGATARRQFHFSRGTRSDADPSPVPPTHLGRSARAKRGDERTSSPGAAGLGEPPPGRQKLQRPGSRRANQTPPNKAMALPRGKVGGNGDTDAPRRAQRRAEPFPSRRRARRCVGLCQTPTLLRGAAGPPCGLTAPTELQWGHTTAQLSGINTPAQLLCLGVFGATCCSPRSAGLPAVSAAVSAEQWGWGTPITNCWCTHPRARLGARVLALLVSVHCEPSSATPF